MLIARPVFLCMVVLGASDMYIGPTNRANFGRGVDVKKSSVSCDDRLQLCEARLSYILSVGVRLLECNEVRKCTLFELRVVHQGVAAASPKMYKKVWQLCKRGRDGLQSLLAEFTCQERSETPTNALHLTGCNIEGFI